MAEFCLECLNKINRREDSPKKYIISKDLDLCEGCGEWKNIVLAEKKFYYYYKFRYLILPFRIVWWVISFLFRLIMLPYLIFKYRKWIGKANDTKIVKNFETNVDN